MHQQNSQTSELQDPRNYPRRYLGCPLQIAEQDRKLKAALFFELGDSELVDRVMRVIKGERG